MAILDDRPSSASITDASGDTPGRRTTDASPSDSSQLDAIDRLILRLERAKPGPHIKAVGVSRPAYFARLRRMLYNREANDVAPAALARLRTELLHPHEPNEPLTR